MGYTFSPGRGREWDAMEGKFCYGRTHTIRDSAQGRRKHGRAVPRVSDFPQNRLQDLRALRGMRTGGAHGSCQAPPPLCQPTARANRSGHRSGQTRETELLGPSLHWEAVEGDAPGSCGRPIENSYKVTYDGGSITEYQSGAGMKLYI